MLFWAYFRRPTLPTCPDVVVQVLELAPLNYSEVGSLSVRATLLQLDMLTGQI